MAKVPVNWGPVTEGESVKLFEVFNTAHRSLHVLAPDRQTAIRIAHTANHVHAVWDRKDKSYPHAAEVRNLTNDRKLAYHADLVQLAIDRRLQGTIHLDGERLYVGDQFVSL